MVVFGVCSLAAPCFPPQHDFSLERKVLYWLEAASQHQTSRHRLTTDTVPTAPPCWLLLVDATEGRETAGGRARDSAVRRCISLNAADQGRGRASDTESEAARPEEDGYLEDDEYSSTSWEDNDRDENIFWRRNQHVFQQIRPKTSPGLLEPPPENGFKTASPDTGKQRRSLVLFNNMKNELEAARRKLAALVHPLNRVTAESGGLPEPPALPQRSRNNRSLKYGPAAAVSCAGGLVPAPPPGPAAPMPPIRKHKPTVPVSCSFFLLLNFQLKYIFFLLKKEAGFGGLAPQVLLGADFPDLKLGKDLFKSGLFF